MKASFLLVKYGRYVTFHKFPTKTIPDSQFYSESIPTQLIKLDMHYPESQSLSPFLNVEYCLMQRLKTLNL